jgi:FtsH-binding integral membrane protein
MYKERTEQSFFSKVYFNMMWALALTGLVAYGVSAYPPFINAIINNVTGLIILMLLEVVLVAVLSRRIMAMSIGAAYVGLMVFSIINGVTLARIFLVYTTTSIVTVFAAAAGLFLVMAVFGYTTKRDLSAWGRFLIMAVFGLIIASVLNLLLRSAMLMYVYSFVGVFIFSGLTAYDTQYLKNVYNNAGLAPEQAEKIAIIGALKLYLDLINLFLMLLRFFGRRR